MGKDHLNMSRAILSSLGLMGFAFFIQFPFPARWISLAALSGVAFLIGWELKTVADLKNITGELKCGRKIYGQLLAGLSCGLFLALFYRWYLDAGFFPRNFRWFALAAASIGGMEELVFRGYVQGHLTRSTGIFSVFFGSLAHTGYKCFLFLSPGLESSIDIGFLAVSTFSAGLLLGAIRYFSGNIWPAVLAHALFDVLIYGENVIAPWWVW